MTGMGLYMDHSTFHPVRVCTCFLSKKTNDEIKLRSSTVMASSPTSPLSCSLLYIHKNGIFNHLSQCTILTRSVNLRRLQQLQFLVFLFLIILVTAHKLLISWYRFWLL